MKKQRPQTTPPKSKLHFSAIAIALSALVWISSCSDETDLNARVADDCELITDGFGKPGQVAIRAEPWVQGLEVPWGLAFLSKSEALVTERPGRVRLIQNGELIEEPILQIEVGEDGEGGLLGIATHPDFNSNRFFYLYYTAESDANGQTFNKVVRYRLSEDHRSAREDRVLIDDIPAGSFHDGGRLRFGPDGKLYVGTGDARTPELAQSLSSNAGKILRLNPDGTTPGDNPNGSPVFISGVRNTQGFDWVTDDILVVTDHGPTGELGRSGHDELSFATSGSNLGWPNQWRCDRESNVVTPSLVWEEALPPGGATWYEGSSIPEWQGSLLIGSLGSEHLQRVVIDRDGEIRVRSNEVYLDGEFGRLRDVVEGPDGALYVTTSNCDSRGSCGENGDLILRITGQ